MTLKRKSIISWTTYAAIYGACLLLSMFYMLQVKGFAFLGIIAVCFHFRVHWGLDKYLIWGSFVAIMMSLKFQGYALQF